MADPTLTEGMRTIESRKSYAAIALAVTMAAYILLAGIDALQMDGQVNFETEMPDELTSLAAVVAIAAFLSSIVTMILVSVWIYRGHANLRAAGYEKQFTPGWAVGWFFVPFANLVMPFRAMRELWNLSHNLVNSQDAPAPSELTKWWACWLIGNILSNVGLQLESLEGSIGLIVGMAGSLLLVAAAWFLRNILIAITATQRSMVGIHETFA